MFLNIVGLETDIFGKQTVCYTDSIDNSAIVFLQLSMKYVLRMLNGRTKKIYKLSKD